MPQLSLYVSESNMQSLRMRASQAGMSLSKYANMLIERDAASDRWPEGFWGLYGSVADESFSVPDDMPPADNDEFVGMFA